MDKRFSAFQHILERYSHAFPLCFDNFSEVNCTYEPIFFVRKKTSIKLTQQRYYCCEKWLQFWTAACLNQVRMSRYIQKLGFVLKNYTDGLGHLVFTNVCLHCNKELVVQERYLCWLCWEGLERTYFELQKTPTKLDQLFWTPIEIKHTCALYFYQKGAVSQSLIRALKYDFKAPLGIMPMAKVEERCS